MKKIWVCISQSDIDYVGSLNLYGYEMNTGNIHHFHNDINS